MDPHQVVVDGKTPTDSWREDSTRVLSLTSGTSTTALTESLGLGCQIVLILVGLVGSGKSTFAQALQEHYPHFQRCNQDELGDRRAVENLARRSLQEGLSVCIDRTNFDAKQRATWISMARERPGSEAWVLVFATPFQLCEERLFIRRNHPTITSPEQALDVLRRFRSQYQIPQQHEGYDRKMNLEIVDQHVNYTSDDIRAILQRLQVSPKIAQSVRSDQPDYNSYRNQSIYSTQRDSSSHLGFRDYRASSNHPGFTGYRAGTNYLSSWQGKLQFSGRV
ncbi:P-loop containing nucleoside triphosphate hydrolase protein [Cytidiella melzeri]|nr:P-loop containing nucleoside triphosphate hydrolase protein [Cytidiella melzeri]